MWVSFHPLHRARSASKKGTWPFLSLLPKLPSPTIITQPKQGCAMRSTAAVERGPSEGARSGSKESFSYPCARIRRDEYEDFETLVRVILHAVLFSSRRHCPLPRAQHLLL